MAGYRNPTFGRAVVSGTITAISAGVALAIVGVPLDTFISAFLGGVTAGMVLTGNSRRAAAAGAISSVISLPIEVFLFSGLMASGLIKPPALPQMPEPVLLQLFIFAIFAQVASGAAGGFLTALFYPKTSWSVPREVASLHSEGTKLCVQCGARISEGAVDCPECKAKQPT